MSQSFLVLKVTPAEWAQIAEGAHRVVFKEERPKHMDRVDYVLLVEEGTGQPSGYCTVRELDAESVYWQYGGAFPGTHSSSKAVECYGSLIDWTRTRYARISTLVENSNVRYLKLAMHYGFRVIGCRTFQGKIYLELLNELRGEKNDS